MPPGGIFELEIYQNVFPTGASPQTPPGELTALHRPSSWFSGAALWQGREGSKWERREGRRENEREGKGKRPHFFLQFNP